ncbi:ZINC INDUCED FACILITATOR-LIKE 1-like [Paramuricea clavata]|uniref:ZINC INDUCED FACILITATOR-LIKE 1-like n=1 Tax=Paramuricea clavata TaxID=317549 RepID=A0A7D9HS64_PARCT|nr:ZINC INDUCED FACILITATOR-LIKE 1-like [Paramuricea clavata]
MSCGVVQWLSVRLFSVIRPKGSTPLPSGVIIALFVSMFGHAIAMQMLFAFLPDMVKSFGITDEDAGIPGTVKASLAEVCNDSNQALGMSVVVTAWNTGLIIGPAIGGYLANPVEKYSVFKESSFFENFAYLFPCLVNAAICFFSFLLVFFIFPETLASKRKTKDKEIPVSILNPETEIRKTSQASSNRQRATPKTSQNHLPDGCQSGQEGEDATIQNSISKTEEMLLLSGSVSFLPEIHLQSYAASMEKNDDAKEEPYVPTVGKAKPGVLRKTYKSMKQSKLAKLCRNKDVRYCVGVYTVFSFAVVAENEMYSLWAATGKEFGGLDFSTDDLGFTLMIVGIGCAISNCIVFPQMVKTFGLMKTQFITLIGMVFFTTVLPATNSLYGREVILKAVVIVVVLIIRVFQGCCFTGQFIMIGNSVTSELRATAHGFSTSAVCAARTVAPTVAGSMFSWSITSGLGFPFNEKFVFIFIGFVTWLALVVACCLDEEAVTKRTTN